MYKEKTPLEKAVGTLLIMKEMTEQKIREIAEMYGVQITELKPLIQGEKSCLNHLYIAVNSFLFYMWTGYYISFNQGDQS